MITVVQKIDAPIILHTINPIFWRTKNIIIQNVLNVHSCQFNVYFFHSLLFSTYYIRHAIWKRKNNGKANLISSQKHISFHHNKYLVSTQNTSRFITKAHLVSPQEHISFHHKSMSRFILKSSRFITKAHLVSS